MRGNVQWDWLLDDWDRAVRRSLVRRLTRRQIVTMRRQWRLGQGAKGGMLFLPIFLAMTYMLPGEKPLLGWAVFTWSTVEFLLLFAHVSLGVGSGVSFGWGFHHGRPLLLSGLAANRDLRIKTLLAALFGIVSLLSLLLV